MATNNACNYTLGSTGQVLTMINPTTAAFAAPSFNRSQTSASRSLNTVFQVSTSSDFLLNYSVDISCTLSITGGQVGTVYLEMATNAAFTTGVQTLSRFTNGNSGTLTIGLNITQICTGNLTGYVPANNYVRLRTENGTGTPTFTYRIGQEILL